MSRLRGTLVLLGVTLMFCFAVVAAPAYADGSAPAWAIGSASSPTNFAAGDQTGDDMYVLTVVDTGEGSATPGSRIEVRDALPGGLVASSISGEDLGNGQALSCSLTPTLGCGYEGFEVAPGDVLRIELGVKVGSGVGSSVVNSATVTGGGAVAGARTEDQTTISSAAAAFGISSFAAALSGTQAGAAVNVTAGFTLNQVVAGGETRPAAAVKEVVLSLPPGFVANPTVIPRCSLSDAEENACPASDAVGVAFTSSSSGTGGEPVQYSTLLYNAAPFRGEPGALVMMLPGGPVWLGLRAGPDGDYGLHVQAEDLPEVQALLGMTLTLWGDPGAYDGFGPGPDHVLAAGAPSFGSPGGPPARFLTAPGACGASSAGTLSADSWAAPSVFAEASSLLPALTGCERLAFAPALAVVPDVSEADEPSGYQVDLSFPQSEYPEGLASAEPRDAAVTLPEGAGISLPTVNGLQACSPVQVGLGSSAAAMCPEASKVGQAVVETPLSAIPLAGAVYVAEPSENPFAALFAIYIVAEEPISGVGVKLAGRLEPDPVTGRLTIALRELPQLPISGLEMHFFAGPRALLANPPTCGLATSTSEETPWSSNEPVSASSSFEINSGADGLACSDPQPFSPQLQVESTTDQAGAYDSLTLVLSRADREQELGTLTLQAPQAVAEMFTEVPPCGEPQATQGTCPEASKIGTAQITAGAGPIPYTFPGSVYLTGSYHGATQGLAIVVPFDAGPFVLDTAVIRASLQADLGTGQLRIESDPLPTILDGVPLRLRTLALQLDQGDFELDSDGCEQQAITGTITSTQGSSTPISADPFGAPTQCKSPQAETSGPAASDTPSSIANVTLRSKRIVTKKDGEATVELACTATGPCRGKLTLTVKTRTAGKRKHSKATTIGAAGFSIPAGKSTTVKIQLDPAGRTLLNADHGRLSASLTILKSSPAPVQTHSEDVRLVRQKR
jgi:hypothetical protein